jgi:hypothetical protein
MEGGGWQYRFQKKINIISIKTLYWNKKTPFYIEPAAWYKLILRVIYQV